MVWSKGQGPFDFHCGCPIVLVPFVEKIIFYPLNYLSIFVKNSIDHLNLEISFSFSGEEWERLGKGKARTEVDRGRDTIDWIHT